VPAYTYFAYRYQEQEIRRCLKGKLRLGSDFDTVLAEGDAAEVDAVEAQ